MKRFYVMAAFALIAGCATMGYTPPNSFDQRIAYVYGTVSALRVSAAQALNSHDLAPADAQHVLEVTDSARQLLDAAEVSQVSGDTGSAQQGIAAATMVLTQLQQFLINKGVK